MFVKKAHNLNAFIQKEIAKSDQRPRNNYKVILTAHPVSHNRKKTVYLMLKCLETQWDTSTTQACFIH